MYQPYAFFQSDNHMHDSRATKATNQQSAEVDPIPLSLASSPIPVSHSRPWSSGGLVLPCGRWACACQVQMIFSFFQIFTDQRFSHSMLLF